MILQPIPKYGSGATPVWTRGAKTHISDGAARNAHTPICRFVPLPGGGHYSTAIYRVDTLLLSKL